jgi:hypothetical protein
MDYSIEDEIITTTARYYGVDDTQSLHFVCKREAAKSNTQQGKIAAIGRGIDLIRPGFRKSVKELARNHGRSS